MRRDDEINTHRKGARTAEFIFFASFASRASECERAVSLYPNMNDLISKR
jgi:hypothetical protein